MRKNPLLAARGLRAIPALLDELGVPPQNLLLRSGFRANPQDWDDLIVTQSQMLHLLQSAADAAGDAHLPARIGGRLMASLQVVAEAMSHARNLAEAVRAGNRALKLWRQGVDFRIATAAGYAAISQHLDDVPASQVEILGEMALSTVCSLVRNQINPAWTPVAVVLPRSRARFHQGLEDIFQAPIFYRAGAPRVVFDAALLTRPFRAPPRYLPDPSALSVNLLRDDDQLVEQLQLVVDGMLALGDLSIEGAADTLGLPVRTMQAQLAGMGNSFSDLVEERRRLLAARYLGASDMRVGEIAMLLGYNDASNFTRAFRRWHSGLSPSEFRRNTLMGG